MMSNYVNVKTTVIKKPPDSNFVPHGLIHLEKMCSFKKEITSLLLVVCDTVSSVCTGEVFILNNSWAVSEVGKYIEGPSRNFFSFFN